MVHTIALTPVSAVAESARVALASPGVELAATIEDNEWTKPAKERECDPAKAAAAAAAVSARTSLEEVVVELVPEPVWVAAEEERSREGPNRIVKLLPPGPRLAPLDEDTTVYGVPPRVDPE